MVSCLYVVCLHGCKHEVREIFEISLIVFLTCFGSYFPLYIAQSVVRLEGCQREVREILEISLIVFLTCFGSRFPLHIA